MCNSVGLTPARFLTYSYIYCCYFTFAEHVFAEAHTAVCVYGACIAAGACQMRFVAAIVNVAECEGTGAGHFCIFRLSQRIVAWQRARAGAALAISSLIFCSQPA